MKKYEECLNEIYYKFKIEKADRIRVECTDSIQKADLNI